MTTEQALTFKCADCGQTKRIRIPLNDVTGYVAHNSKIVCYLCCGIRDRADMVATGKATMYLTSPTSEPIGNCILWTDGWKVSNWPNTLSFAVGGGEVGRHNIAGKRYDVWFNGPDGHVWHGVQYGDNTQICHCKRTKQHYGGKIATGAV